MIFLYFVPLIVILIVLSMFISKGIITMKTRASAVNETKYLKQRKAQASVSPSNSNLNLIHPFNLNIDPMDKLILFDIEDDPLYTTLELQEFDDETSRGLVILMYRKDKEIDVYYTAGIAHDFYKGSPKGSVKEIVTDDYYFRKTDEDFNFLVSFKDKDGNNIYIKADEKNPDKKHFSILAPAGDMIDNFTSFPLFFMKETAFLEVNHAHIIIRIGEEERKPVAIPISINGNFVYLSRYCLEPVVASFNENFEGLLESSNLTSGGKLESLKCNKLNHQVSLKFSPPFPDLCSMEDNVRIKGRFSSSVDSVNGILAGEYSIESRNGTISVALSPKKGWQPMPGRKWFKKYKWISKVSFKEEGVYAVSEWVKS